MLVKSDLVLAMTPEHLGVLRNARPDLASRMRMLRDQTSRGFLIPLEEDWTNTGVVPTKSQIAWNLLLDDLIQKDTDQK